MGSLKRGVRNVFRNLLRLTLVVGMLGASLMFVAMMVGLNGNAQQQLARAYAEIGTGIDVTAPPQMVSGPSAGGDNSGPSVTQGGDSNSKRVPNKLVEAARKLPGVVRLEEHLFSAKEKLVTTLAGEALKIKMPQIQTSEGVEPQSGPQGIPAAVNGISVDAKNFTLDANKDPSQIVAGRRFNQADKEGKVVLMGKEMADLNKLHVGDQILIGGQRFTIVGLYTSQEMSANMSVAIPIKTMQQVLKIDGVDSITVYAKDYASVPALSEKLRALVEKEGFDVNAHNRGFQDTIDSLATTQRSIIFGLFVSIAIAVIVIIFAVILVVRERGTEIGVLRAIGASRWQIIRQFWVEITTTSGIAAVLAAGFLLTLGPAISSNFKISSNSSAPQAMPGGGVMVSGGPGMTGSLNNFQLGTVTLTPQTLLVILLAGIALAMLSSLIPAWYVARLRPAEVLRRNAL